MRTVTPINAAAAALLGAKASGAPPLVPVTDIAHPELARLLMLQLENGSIPAGEYQRAEQATGWSKRHLQRRLAQLRTTSPGVGAPKRRRFELTDHHKQIILACSGNVRLAYEQVVAAGEELPSYETFWRRFSELPTGVQAYARKGAQGLVDFWLYPPYEAPERNEVWQADHFELPVDVVADGHSATLVKPWLTIFEDDRTRMVMGWSLLAVPNRRTGAAEVCATIVGAVRLRIEHDEEVGGVPRRIRWDNDRSFVNDQVTQLGSALGFECHAVPPYSGHMKGKVERLGRRVQEAFCALQPAYTHGPTTYTGKDLFRDAEPLTAAQLRARLDLWFAQYNHTVHQGHGATPFAQWSGDPTPLRRATDDVLREALLVERRARTVNKRKGVHFHGRWWQSAGMIDVVGRKVEIRYPISDDSFIELYHRGRWHSTAWPADTLTDDQKRAIWDRRNEMYAEVRELHDHAREIRVGADAQTPETDATPAMASVPAIDRLEGDPDDLYRLIDRIATGTDAQDDSDHSPNGTEEPT